MSNDITRYMIISKIGEGSFSKVYRVRDSKTNKYYAAKVSNIMIDEYTEKSQEAILLFREVNLMSLLNHPSVLKFVGYYPTNFEQDPLPTIITELATNGSLRDILNMEIQGISPDEWDFTKKLINVYGIACGMSYLHSNNILHRDLKSANILLNDYLHPKISDFGLSKITDFLSLSMNMQSQSGPKGTPAYMAPEIISKEEYSKSSDVYAFGFIVYEIVSSEEPFKDFSFYQLMKKVMVDGFRPEIKNDVPNAYKNLIEKCWSQDKEERPSFDQIVDELKNNDEFITDLIDQNEYFDYVDYVDNCRSTFNASNQIIHFDDFIKLNGRNKSIKPISFNETFSEENSEAKPQINLVKKEEESDIKTPINKNQEKNGKLKKN